MRQFDQLRALLQ